MTDQIDDGRKQEIADQFAHLLRAGFDTGRASKLICNKYNLTPEEVDEIVREFPPSTEPGNDDENT